MGPICNLMLKGIIMGEKNGQETIELWCSKIKVQDKVIKSGSRLTNDCDFESSPNAKGF